MISILNVQILKGCKIISYDLALIFTVRSLRRAQRCLGLSTGECRRIGLKLSAAKSKAMALRLDVPDSRLRVQRLVFQYLGVWADHRLKSRREGQYLIIRIKAGLPVMKAMSVALISVTPTPRQRIELIQNESTRIVLGAPSWTKSVNLRMEANLLLLYILVNLMAAQIFFVKVIRVSSDSHFRRKVQRRLELDYQSFANGSWLSQTARVLMRFQLKTALLAKELDSPDLALPRHRKRAWSRSRL